MQRQAIMNSDFQYTVLQFYLLAEQKDMLNWMELWSERAEIIFPYSNDLVESQLIGKAAIHQYWLVLWHTYARLKLTIEGMYTQQNRIVVLFKSENLIKNSQAFYQDENIGLFEFEENGKIKSYTEYFDPLKLLKNAHLFSPNNKNTILGYRYHKAI